MIRYILQVDGQNLLQVVYSSGVNRYITPDGWGNYFPNMTKPQRDFMKNSITVERKGFSPWERKITYWINKDNPEPGLMSCGR